MSAEGGGIRVVAFGGGHGLAASLAALRRLTGELTAVVTVADDGGSSGRLRREFPGLLPPGDLRMAMAALAADDADSRLWRDVLQHRFSGGGQLAGHAAGNIVLAALMQVLGDPVVALDRLAEAMGACGRVLPMSVEPLDIVADVSGLDPADPSATVEVRGQGAVASTGGRVVSVRLVPEDPRPCPQAVDAVDAADWLILGPGSWFTSVLPHVLVPELAKAMAGARARRLLALNLDSQPGETEGFSPEAHLEVFGAYAPDLEVDVVLADVTSAPDDGARTRLADVARGLGAQLVVDRLRTDDGSPHHDPERLAAAYRQIFETMAGRGEH